MSKANKYNRKQIRAFIRANREITTDWILGYFFDRNMSPQAIADECGLSYSGVRTFLFQRYRTHILDWVNISAKEIALISARLNR